MPSYKLNYFNGMARAEVARYLFVLGDIEYVDNRLDREAWLKFKQDTPFGQMPVLEVDGVMICQSHAIEGYLARKVGRVGKTDLDHARCHMIVDCVEDMFRALTKTFSEPDEKKKVLKKEFAETGIHQYLENFSKLLSDKGYFVGEDLTWPDICLHHVLDNITLMGVPDAELQVSIAKFPKVVTMKKNVNANEKCAKWIKNRPKTEF